jgi:hypothetical protein
MRYQFTAIPDEQVPQAADTLFQHLVTTYASETNKTASVWRAVAHDLLGYRPHEKTNTIRAILVPGPDLATAGRAARASDLRAVGKMACLRLVASWR